MNPNDRVKCSPYTATLTAKACVTRHLATRDRTARHLPAFPECAKCPLGRRRAEALERAGESVKRRALRFMETMAVAGVA